MKSQGSELFIFWTPFHGEQLHQFGEEIGYSIMILFSLGGILGIICPLELSSFLSLKHDILCQLIDVYKTCQPFTLQVVWFVTNLPGRSNDVASLL